MVLIIQVNRLLQLVQLLHVFFVFSFVRFLAGDFASLLSQEVQCVGACSYPLSKDDLAKVFNDRGVTAVFLAKVETKKNIGLVS